MTAGTPVPFDGCAEAPVSTSEKLAPADFRLGSGALSGVEIVDRLAAIRTLVYMHSARQNSPTNSCAHESPSAMKIKQLTKTLTASAYAIGKDRQGLPPELGKDCRVAAGDARFLFDYKAGKNAANRSLRAWQRVEKAESQFCRERAMKMSSRNFCSVRACN